MPSPHNPVVVEVIFDGRRMYKELRSGWTAPVVAGADDGDDSGDQNDSAAVVSTPDGSVFVPATGTQNSATTGGTADDLGDAGKAALTAERSARKQAEKQARDALAKLQEIENQSLSETEKLKREAEDGRSLASKASGLLQQAKLLGALLDAGFTGARAKAASKLIEGIEFDDEGDPTNLSARLKAAEREYGDLVKPTPPATDFDGGARESSNTSGDFIRDGLRQLRGGNR